MKYKKKDYKTWNKAQKARFLKIAKEHQEADRFIQGDWLRYEKVGKEFKGCFYGCMTQTEDNTLEEAVRVMNLPAWIIHVSEKIFEGLPKEEAIKFPLQLLEAIPNGLDTYQLWKDWSYILLMDKNHGNIKYCGENKKCIDAVKQVAELFKTDFTESAARSATKSAAWSAKSADSAVESSWSAESAARFAAESAAWSAKSADSAVESSWSAESAAWSAWSAARSAESYAIRENHYIWLRDTLINLLKIK